MRGRRLSKFTERVEREANLIKVALAVADRPLTTRAIAIALAITENRARIILARAVEAGLATREYIDRLGPDVTPHHLYRRKFDE